MAKSKNTREDTPEMIAWKEEILKFREDWIKTLKQDQLYTIEDFRTACLNAGIGNPPSDDKNNRDWGGMAPKVFTAPTKTREVGFRKVALVDGGKKRHGRAVNQYRCELYSDPFLPWRLYVVVAKKDKETPGRVLPKFLSEIYASHANALIALQEMTPEEIAERDIMAVGQI